MWQRKISLKQIEHPDHFDDNINTEWMLRQVIFLSITQLWGKPEIDLFASRLNAQLPCYASWKPNHGASFTDSFTIPWTDYYFYAFPPFSIILRTQPWHTKPMQMITDYSRLLPVQKSILTHPSKKGSYHQLWQRLHLMACKLSGQPCKSRAFRKRQQTSSLNPGDQEQPNSTNLTSGNGYSIVVKGALIQLIPLWDKH